MTDFPTHNEQEELRRRFKAARKRSRLSQDAAARALDMSLSSVTRKERGEQVLTKRDVALMEQIADGSRVGMVPHTSAESGDWADMLDSEPAEAYLAEVLAEAKKLGIPHDWRNATLLSIKQPPPESARPAGAMWSVEEVVDAMKDQGEPIRRQWRIWARNR